MRWNERGRAGRDAVDRAAERVQRDPASRRLPSPATFWKFSTPASRVPIPLLLSGLVKKSDLAYSEARESWPPEV